MCSLQVSTQLKEYCLQTVLSTEWYSCICNESDSQSISSWTTHRLYSQFSTALLIEVSILDLCRWTLHSTLNVPKGFLFVSGPQYSSGFFLRFGLPISGLWQYKHEHWQVLWTLCLIDLLQSSRIHRLYYFLQGLCLWDSWNQNHSDPFAASTRDQSKRKGRGVKKRERLELYLILCLHSCHLVSPKLFQVLEPKAQARSIYWMQTIMFFHQKESNHQWPQWQRSNIHKTSLHKFQLHYILTLQTNLLLVTVSHLGLLMKIKSNSFQVHPKLCLHLQYLCQTHSRTS